MRSKNAKMEPRWAQDRSKIDPRSFWIDFFYSSVFVSFFNRFRLRFGAVWGAKMDPKSDTELPEGGPWGVQGGLGLVLVRSLVRLVARVRFWSPLALLLGPFWDALGPILGLLGASLRVLWGPPWDFHLACGPVLGPCALAWRSARSDPPPLGLPRREACRTDFLGFLEWFQEVRAFRRAS